ncbi:MAG: MMPL family transporter, partial [Candidatus Tectomicrobia bacterium]|nr:MMPL family transporter [Candidatus Tectomicrobia bacterium]
TNQEIAWSSHWNDIMVFGMVFFCVFVSYFSLVASLLIVTPLFLANLVCLSYMVFSDIGMNINTLPVASIGVGVGVDYAVYIVDRMKNEYFAAGKNMDLAITKAITTTGMAVTFTATCLVGGIIFWYPLSPIRFQCEMAILLALLMAMNAFMAVTLVPALFSIIKPKFALAMQSIPRGRRMIGSGAAALFFMGAVTLYGLWTGHRNIDADFFRLVTGLIVVLLIFGMGVQNVEA